MNLAHIAVAAVFSLALAPAPSLAQAGTPGV